MNRKEKQKIAPIANRAVARFVLLCLALLLLLLGGFFGAWFVCTNNVWAPGELYDLLKILEVLSPLIIVGALLCGGFLLAIYSIRRTARYLGDLAVAAKKLAHPDGEMIVLPDELGGIQDELNLAREEALRNIAVAKDAVQRKNDLIMYLAHDLKTPLASVIGYLSLLRDEEQISEELRGRYLSVALDKAERLEDLINEFFEIARFNLSTVTLQYGRINLTRLLEQLIYEFRPALEERKLQCRLCCPADVMLRCDADKLQRVFDNLLRNAVFYSYEHTEILITVEQEENRLRIRFVNQGDTIPEDKLERIFEQFYRLDTARGTKSGGAGLGLAIAKQLVELHGGTVTAQSGQERTAFEVVLPAA